MSHTCLVATLAQLVVVALASKKVVIAGDSMGEYAAKTLETYCPGVTVYNAAIGGTRADQWLDPGLAEKVGTAACGGTPDYIWLTVGGNDHLNTECNADVATVASKVTASINAMKARAPGVPILIVGYPMANGPEGGRRLANPLDTTDENDVQPRRLPCNTPENLYKIMASVKQAAEADSAVTFVDSTNLFGGSPTSWSPKRYHADAIHLNNQGYCKLFTQSAVQAFFGCQTTSPFDCDSYSCDITGYSSCGDGIMTSCPGCTEFCVLGASGPTPSPSANTTGGIASGCASLMTRLLAPVLMIAYLRV